MSSYGYEYGYSSYGYTYYSYGNDSYVYYSPRSSSYPNPGLYLSGPGSSVEAIRPYGESFIYETQRGGYYHQSEFHTSSGYVSQTSYQYFGSDYNTSQSYKYENFTDRSGPSYNYIGYGYSYYSPSYSISENYSRNNFTESQHTVGNTTYVSSTGIDTFQTTSGYIYSSYTFHTNDAVNGIAVVGSGSSYVLDSVTDPYGYSTYSSHTVTF